MIKRTSPTDFKEIADPIIDFVRSSPEPVSLTSIEFHFPGNYKIAVGRVVLCLIADRELYFTEDRRIACPKQKFQTAPN